MHKERESGSVCFLLGPEQDRQDFHSYFEQSGYKVNVFKNPSVLFDYLQEFKPFVVVLDTSALRTKLSHWVSQLHSIRPGQAWLAMAPTDQYTILATYQNRGLCEIVMTDVLHVKERTLWALDREFEKHNLNKKPVLSFVESANPRQSSSSGEMNLETLIGLRARESNIRKMSFSFAVISLDDQKEIHDFWGEDILAQAQDLLLRTGQERWGLQNVLKKENSLAVVLNKPAAQVLADIQLLQSEIQNLGQQKFGFKFSISGGISQLSVHTHEIQDLIRVSSEACLKMQSKGGGRVAIPKPLHEGTRGELPQDLG